MAADQKKSNQPFMGFSSCRLAVIFTVIAEAHLGHKLQLFFGTREAKLLPFLPHLHAIRTLALFFQSKRLLHEVDFLGGEFDEFEEVLRGLLLWKNAQRSMPVELMSTRFLCRTGQTSKLLMSMATNVLHATC